jgi:hypothetical protein
MPIANDFVVPLRTPPWFYAPLGLSYKKLGLEQVIRKIFTAKQKAAEQENKWFFGQRRTFLTFITPAFLARGEGQRELHTKKIFRNF